MKEDYELLDSGDGRKFERFGAYSLVRPCSQALWQPAQPTRWAHATATFDRTEGNHWHGRGALPSEWVLETVGLRFRLSGTDFGHLGIFPEQRAQWQWLRNVCQQATKPLRVLNLFAYSGGSTLACALGGAEVCHLDAARGMVEWARANASLNQLEHHPIRWITDDAHKFLRREVRRAHRYEGIIFDPPTFGRGANGETYKIERDLKETIALIQQVLAPAPRFVLFSSHTPGLSCQVAHNIMTQSFSQASQYETGEMLLEGSSRPCPSGIFARALWN